MSEEIAVLYEISKDSKDAFDLLREIHTELRLIRTLTEMHVLQTKRMKKQYERERQQLESANLRNQHTTAEK